MLNNSNATTNCWANTIIYFAFDVCSFITDTSAALSVCRVTTELCNNWPEVSSTNTVGTSSNNVMFCSFHQLAHLLQNVGYPRMAPNPVHFAASVYSGKMGEKNMSERNQFFFHWNGRKMSARLRDFFFLTVCNIGCSDVVSLFLLWSQSVT